MVKPKQLMQLYDMLEKRSQESGFHAGKSGRHMKFPYTFSAKVAQFPLFFYMKNNWIWMYYPLGAFVAFYAFYKIHRIVNSEASKKNWADSQRKIAEKEAAHH
ncbi:unnamed protein product [Chrysodeixis includens]|uniref:Uncharacterized protein n=1 Tax=Chrysodeixis includens TaxID=689277 RepID=A0A9P0C136_CHRIL|nr:unnamed protein product [Chrysodeixis includens]